MLAALCAAAVYLPTMAPGVLWGDSGDAQIRVLLGQFVDPRAVARAHVPYYAVAVALQRASGCDAALAANLVSALAGVVTVANCAALLASFIRRRLAVVCASALLLLSHTLWQLAAGAEVVTFSTMCLSFELLCLVRFARTDRLRWLILVALANGVGWSTHNFALLTWPAYAVLAASRWTKIPAPRALSLAAAAGAWLLGCLPLAVVTAAEYRQLGSVADTVRSVFVGGYAPAVFNARISAGLLLRVLAFAALNFPTPLILLALPGWWWLRGKTSRSLWLFLTISGAAFLVFGARYTVPDQHTFLVPAFLFAVLFAGAGLDGWLERHRSRAMGLAVVLLALIGPVFYAVAPGLVRTAARRTLPVAVRHLPYREPYAWFLRPWRNGYDGAERYAREVFALLPPNAVFHADSTALCPLQYLQLDQGLRRDVRLPYGHHPASRSRPFQIRSHEFPAYIERGLAFAASDRRERQPKWLSNAGYRFTPVGCVFRIDMPLSDAPDHGQ